MLDTLTEFTEHLAHCRECDVKLDGSGPVCATGEALEFAARWDADAERARVDTEFAGIIATMGNCPAGGDHVPGSSGEWAGRCTKCGSPC